MNADVIGLTEIENDGYGPDSALQFLVDRLNEAIGAGHLRLHRRGRRHGADQCPRTGRDQSRADLQAGQSLPGGQHGGVEYGQLCQRRR